MRGGVGKKIPKKEMENMTSQEVDVVKQLCILGFVEVCHKICTEISRERLRAMPLLIYNNRMIQYFHVMFINSYMINSI